MSKEKITLKGIVTITHLDEDKKVKSIERYENLIVNIGRETIAKLFNGLVSDAFKYLAVGSSSTAESNTQTALISEITSPNGMARGLADCSYNNYTAILEKIFTNDGESNITVREAGIFNASSDGQMFSRKVMTDKLLAPNESLLINWQIQFNIA
jgi:hypothetical protein